MKVAELKVELEARGASKTARDKMALRLRLRALMLRAALDTRRAEEGGGGYMWCVGTVWSAEGVVGPGRLRRREQSIWGLKLRLDADAFF